MKSLPLTEVEDKARVLEEDAVKLHTVVGAIRSHTAFTAFSEIDGFEITPPTIKISLSGGCLENNHCFEIPRESFTRVFATLRMLMRSEAYKLVTDVASIMPGETYDEFMGELRDPHVQAGAEEG